MRDPEGNEFPNRGIYLELVENERLVLTDAYPGPSSPLTLRWRGVDSNPRSPVRMASCRGAGDNGTITVISPAEGNR
jgi:uncharacterized protein YndB with AHSA1/START domain